MSYASPGLHSNTILILPVSDLLDYHRFGPWIDHAATLTSKRLLIFLVSHLFNSENEEGPDLLWKSLEKLLSFVYTRASKMAIKTNRILMNIDVVLHAVQGRLLSGVERENSVEWEMVFTPTDVRFESLPDWISNIPRAWLQMTTEVSTGSVTEQEHAGNLPTGSERHPRHYPVVALGGTFDHLHAGHKILLSMSAWIAGEKVIVGVTDDTLLTKKANRDVLESLERRTESVRQFLELFRPQIQHEAVPISDVYGPTATDPNIQALIVSKETLSGAAAIAKIREERSLPGLETYVIDVIAGESDSSDLGAEEDMEKLRKAKMSSTYIRQWIVQHNHR